MRRHTDKGFQGNLSMNASFASSLQSYQPSGSLNYHSGKWDTYGFASGTLVPQNKGDLYVTRDYVAGDKGFSSLTRMKQPSRYGTIRMGTVYTMDSSNSLGVELEYVRRGYIWPSQSYSTLSVGPLDMESQGVYRQKETYNMYTATANYIHKLDKDGSVLKLVTDYISKDLHGRNQYQIFQEIGALNKDTVYRSRSNATYQIATADLSWKQQLHKKSFFQIGMKYTYTGMKDDACYEGLEPDESWKPNVAYGYELDYHENIGALYGTYSLDMKRGSVHIGLRGEYTQTSNETERRTRKYWDWFPHIDGNFYFDEIHKWMLIGQYGRYIERPTFSALNPNRIQTSEYSYLIGNPMLRPTYINKFSITLVYNFRYTLTVGGNLHHDLIRQFGKVDRVICEPGISFKIPLIERTQSLPKETLLYDLEASDVITKDKKTMISDSYVLWRITDPLKFAQTLNSSLENSESRINTAVYNATKNVISSLSQDRVITSRDGELSDMVMEAIGDNMEQYGIELIKFETKQLDLPDDNKAAVYERMISERDNIAATYKAEGDSEAKVIQNKTDKEVTIQISDAKKQAEILKAEGEQEYMKILSQAYGEDERSEFYSFVRSLEALKASMQGENKTVILSSDSPIAQIFEGK